MIGLVSLALTSLTLMTGKSKDLLHLVQVVRLVVSVTELHKQMNKGSLGLH